MTLVLGTLENGSVILGADSAAGDMRSRNIFENPKAFRSGPYVVGFSGSWRLGQTLRRIELPTPPPDVELIEHMIGPFANAVAQAMAEDVEMYGPIMSSLPPKMTGKDYRIPGQILVGVEGRLFMVQPDLAILECSSPSGVAIGSAEAHATGALFAGYELGLRGHDLVEMALRAGEQFTGISGPFVYAETSSCEGDSKGNLSQC